MDVRNVIKSRRLELGLTMQEVADAVGVTQSAVSRWESGDVNNMRRDRIFALAKVLDISPLLILGIEVEPDPDPAEQKARMLERMSVYWKSFAELTDSELKDVANYADFIVQKRGK